jgi:hypothetical protein
VLHAPAEFAPTLEEAKEDLPKNRRIWYKVKLCKNDLPK